MGSTGGPYKKFVNSQFNFIHGILSPRGLGSCSSLPVLFAVIGRRLGYPVKLVLTVNHIFNRWVDENEQFNMDGSMKYIGGDEDHHYIDRWRPWRDWERKSTAFHRPLTPREELATFIFNRSICESANLRFDEARESCKLAARFQPDHYGYIEEQETILHNQNVTQRIGWLQSSASSVVGTTGPLSVSFRSNSPQPQSVTSFVMDASKSVWNYPVVEYVFKRKES
jgi:hypothetical protein